MSGPATQLYVSGPARISVGPAANTSGSGSAGFLGYTQGEVPIREQFFTQPVYADYGGKMMAIDQLDMGKMVVIQINLVKYDYTVLNTVKARVWGGTKGAIASNEIGSLINQEGLGFQLWVQAPYQGKTIYGAIEPGVHLPICYAMGDIAWRNSTNELIHTLVFATLPNFNTSTLSGTVWDSDMSGAAAAT